MNTVQLGNSYFGFIAGFFGNGNLNLDIVKTTKATLNGGFSYVGFLTGVIKGKYWLTGIDLTGTLSANYL